VVCWLSPYRLSHGSLVTAFKPNNKYTFYVTGMFYAVQKTSQT